MIQDLHSHTYYSFCGGDKPQDVIEGAVAGGIELLGICDHNHGIGCGRYDVFQSESEDISENYGRNLEKYFDHIELLREKYEGKIKILRGIEVSTHTYYKRTALPASADISFFDYCLVENLDSDRTVTGGDIFSFAERCATPVVGIAHTDMFAFMRTLGEDPYNYFRKMADRGIFWEMNVSFDSVHHYREHQYMLNFFEDKEKQQIVRESGVRLSVGFDGHRIAEYRPDRVKEYCKKVHDAGIKLVFE